MYLKSIELSGFKSFAKKSVLEFTSPITAIVGPNGSGKSNVAEAFRFVLGEQSLKSMRGKRGEDLIWNGSSGLPRGNRASVKLVFDNPREKRIFDIDFPEVSIERSVHRDGVNEYSLNSSKVRLKDIVEMLLSAGIGSSGHHIISQGEVDRILLANAKERKAMVEDALGLKVYQYKRIESEKKLEKTFENMRQVEALRKEIAPHLKFLKKQMEKFEKAEEEKRELILLAQEYFKLEDDYLKEFKGRLNTNIEPLKERLKVLSNELLLAKKALEEADKGEKKNEILDLEDKLSRERKELDRLVHELGRLEGAITSEERVIKRQRDIEASDEHKMIRLRDLELLVEDLEKESLVDTIKRKLFEFIKSKKDTSDSKILEESLKRLEDLKKDKVRLEDELTSARESEKALIAQYDLLKQEIDKEKDTGRDAERKVFQIMSEENEIVSKLNMLKLEEEKLRIEDEEFKRELEEVAQLVGREVLQFKALEITPESDRKLQEERKKRISRLKIHLEDSGLSGEAEVAKEYGDTSERDEFLARELLDLEKSAKALEDLIKDLEERLSKEFASGLLKINQEFKKLFNTIFAGGDAHLSLVKEKKPIEFEGDEEEVEEGLEISVSLPRKKIRGLAMLSGGERALASIALSFAISQVNPPPFIILDETDAALDEANSRRYGDLVETLSKYSQLILITHNRETMSRAGVIYGVTMSEDGVSKLLSIAFDQAVQVAK